MYSVQFCNLESKWESSRHFDTIRAARNWAKWLLSLKYVTAVKINKGGFGGEPVEIR